MNCQDIRLSTIWIYFSIVLYLPCPLALAQSVNGAYPNQKAPIHIKSDRMEALDQSRTVIFTGHVVATKDNFILHSDKLEVFYDKTQGKGQGNERKRVIKKIVALGHVRISKGRRIGTGQKAVYEKSAEKITITGAAQVWEGPNRVRGDRITFFLNEDRSVVEGSAKTKVQAIVYPKE